MNSYLHVLIQSLNGRGCLHPPCPYTVNQSSCRRTGRGSLAFQVIQQKVGARRTSCFIQCSPDLGPLCPWPSGGGEQGKLRHSLTPCGFLCDRCSLMSERTPNPAPLSSTMMTCLRRWRVSPWSSACQHTPY